MTTATENIQQQQARNIIVELTILLMDRDDVVSWSMRLNGTKDGETDLWVDIFAAARDSEGKQDDDDIRPY